MLNVRGFYMDLAPSPILAVQPTIEMARRFSRLGEMLELSPATAGRISRSSGSVTGDALQ